MDQVSGTKTPPPLPGQAALVTSNYFDLMGRVIAVKLPDSTFETNKYAVTGLLTNKFGSREYPVEHTYDAQGRMKAMTTFKNYATRSGAATTTWNYDPYRGWLLNKRYPDNTGPNYTNTPAGRLKNRLWARGTLTTYAMNNAGDVQSITYSDGTATVTNGYDRRGRVTAIGQGMVVTSRTYADSGAQLTESYSGGPLNGIRSRMDWTTCSVERI